MAQLLEIGKQYRLSLALGVKYEPDTMAGRAAKSWAEKATAAFGAFLEEVRRRGGACGEGDGGEAQAGTVGAAPSPALASP